jgi:hypothetical protein
MAYGLRIFDGIGRGLLEVTDRLPRVWSVHYITSAWPTLTQSGFVSVAGMVRDGSWIVVPGLTMVSNDGSYYYVGTGSPNCWAGTGGFNWNSTNMDLGNYFNFHVTVFRQ